MNREEFVQWAESRGWKIDRFGHLQKEKPSREIIGEKISYRYKLSRIAVRYEVKSHHGWVRLRSGYFSKLSIAPDGKLAGMAR